MSIYMIIEITVKDKKKYAEYIEKAQPIIERFNGEYLVRGGKITSLSGNWSPERIVVLKFPSKDDFKNCFSSKEYEEIAPLRECSAESKAILVEGY